MNCNAATLSIKGANSPPKHNAQNSGVNVYNNYHQIRGWGNYRKSVFYTKFRLIIKLYRIAVYNKMW